MNTVTTERDSPIAGRLDGRVPCVASTKTQPVRRDGLRRLRGSDMTNWAEKLGFSADDRVVVVHVDDIGLCPDANEGALAALRGAATCGSVMVPCPAFEAIAETARREPGLDLGIHLTLNCEYESVRWGPLTKDTPGLRSPDGAMWRTVAETVEHADPPEVERELRAQIERALGAGIDVTHLDSHMGTVLHPKFVDVYVRLGRHYRLPLFLPRVDRKALAARGLEEAAEFYGRLVEDLEAEGFPVFDGFDADSLSFEPGTGLEHNLRRIDRLPRGLSYLITHCARGGEELRGFAPDWRQRDEECRIYSDGTMERAFEERGIRTAGMRALRDLLRSR
ncbi:MAG: carbohydrate deacetylase [Candidatus Binatia bacterium]|nr:MAG: carbohydrate deacetylase [Candidatus Binatia bacterium]